LSARDEARRWLEQAEADLAAAEDVAERHPHVACFLAQQAAEKALKAAQLAAAGVIARTHSLSQVERMLAELGLVLRRVQAQALRDLERMYTEARYPDALPDSIPARYFTPDDARHARAIARAVLADAREIVR
jgi:HEPN domain-containing protein